MIEIPSTPYSYEETSAENFRKLSDRVREMRSTANCHATYFTEFDASSELKTFTIQMRSKATFSKWEKPDKLSKTVLRFQANH